MQPLSALARLLTPPLCAACGDRCSPDRVLCPGCQQLLERSPPRQGAPPPGIERAWSVVRHDGVGREMVGALKYRRLVAVAAPIAERIAAGAPPELLRGEVVPVPSAPVRGRIRGFDPAAEIALALCRVTGLPFSECLRREGGPRQVGRPRRRRLGDPPRVSARAPAPRQALLVDDVWTTGATLSACAAALREAGCRRVAAITFARRL